MKKLHLLEDSVYANWYVSNCKLYNDNTTENVFVCIKNEVSYIKDETVIVCNEGGEYYKQLIDQINSDIYRTVFVNFLDIKKANFINSTTNTKVKFVWILWGGDLYALTKYKFNIYEGFSKKFMTQKGHLNKPTLRMKIGSVKRNIFNKVDPKTLDWQYPIHKSISRLNACATLISKEVALIAKKGNPKISQIPFAMVSSLNDFVFDETVAKNKILVGNSADPATNQYEVLKKLSSIQVLDEVIVPLSYGNADYKTELIKATKNFHLKLNVLTDLLPKAEYYKLLSEVRVAIFPHKIQKAFGNIIALLYFGAKVFLRECNPIYYELNKIGVVVFPINSGLTKNDLEALSPELANKNRTLINNWIGEAKVKSYYNKLLSY